MPCNGIRELLWIALFCLLLFPCEAATSSQLVANGTRVNSATAKPENNVDSATAKPEKNEANLAKVRITRSHFSTEAVAFLGFVAVCLILLIVFFMYLNKMFCFRTIGGFPCVDRPPKKRFDATTGREYSLAEDEEDDDCDSEDDAVVTFQRHKSIRMSKKESSDPVELDSETMESSAVSAVAAAVDQMTSSVVEDLNTARRPSEVGQPDSEYVETLPIMSETLVDSKELSIEVAIHYKSSRGELKLDVNQVKNAPNADHQYQVHVTFLPSKKHAFRTAHAKSENPQFSSSFNCSIPAESLPDTYIRFRLYARAMAISPSKLIGAAIVSLATLPKDEDVTRWLPLQPSENGLWAIDILETDSDQTQGKLLDLDPVISVGLAYSALTGRLVVEIGHAQGLGKLLRKIPPKLETYVKILVMLGPTADRLLAQTKTRLSKGLRPSFKEKFIFHVAQFQLSDVTVGIMLYTRRRENFGWVAIGSIAEPGTLESTHWSELRTAAATHSADIITKVHAIRPPEKSTVDPSRVLSGKNQ